MKDHVITCARNALCGTDSFAAVVLGGQNGCARCQQVLETLLHAIRAMANLPGFDDLCQKDKRVRRAVDIVIANQITNCAGEDQAP